MSESNVAFSPAFIEQQRQRLEVLRATLFGSEERRGDDERELQSLHGGEAREYEDGAQDLARKEVLQALHDVDKPRHEHIERALVKIRDGTYGYSDVSGKRIAQSRLEASPEAILTLEEEAQKEA
jgi:DnaK suppressor protein